jgi:hypothetical protein
MFAWRALFAKDNNPLKTIIPYYELWRVEQAFELGGVRLSFSQGCSILLLGFPLRLSFGFSSASIPRPIPYSAANEYPTKKNLAHSEGLRVYKCAYLLGQNGNSGCIMSKPWINGNGDVVHPDAPSGAGGCGFFRVCGHLGRDIEAHSEVPHPHSPAARYLVLHQGPKKHLKGRPAPKLVRVADAGVDLNAQVKANAADLVGKPVVGSGECYDLADKVLRNASAKSAPDFGKVTKSRNDNHKWGAPVADLKDVKPGDVLQFRDHVIEIKTVKNTKKTYPDGHTVKSVGGGDTETLNRGQHTAVVLSNDGDGILTVAEQHVLDHGTGKLSTTVRQNKLYTQDVPAKKKTKVTEKGGVTTEEETTVTVTVKGTIWAYRPEEKEH